VRARRRQRQRDGASGATPWSGRTARRSRRTTPRPSAKPGATGQETDSATELQSGGARGEQTALRPSLPRDGETWAARRPPKRAAEDPATGPATRRRDPGRAPPRHPASGTTTRPEPRHDGTTGQRHDGATRRAARPRHPLSGTTTPPASSTTAQPGQQRTARPCSGTTARPRQHHDGATAGGRTPGPGHRGRPKALTEATLGGSRLRR
jgi:hypothetical protein